MKAFNIEMAAAVKRAGKKAHEILCERIAEANRQMRPWSRTGQPENKLECPRRRILGAWYPGPVEKGK